MSSARVSWCFVLVQALVLPVCVWARTGTDVVVYSGREFSRDTAEQYGWPEGAIDLVNDPLRTWGHLVWSSGTSNDLLQFVMSVRDGDDVQHHVNSMWGVKSLKRQIILVPGHLPLLPGHGAPPDDKNRYGVIFQIGSQKTINDWYDRLPEVCPGLRRFGNSELNRPPEARPPTLVISASHPLVKLEDLQIPFMIDVKAEIDPAFRAADENRELIERVEQFVARHQARQEAIRNRAR